MSCSITTYCISNTGDALLNDTYLSGGTHNGEPFYSGTTNGYVIYYTTSNQWCLSDVLDGTCFLSGKFPCTSVCPDISSEYLFSGVCPSTTTTTTIDCSVLDFEAIFDCDITTTTTSTSTSTTTTSTTTIPPDPCSGTSVDASIQILPTTTSTTSTTTTTTTLPVDRPCVFSGDVTFNTIMGEIICPYSFEFQDCFNGMKYLTTSQIVNPSGGTINEFMVFRAEVNGETKCISYVGINLTEIGGDIITLINGPYGFSNLGECVLCNPDDIICARWINEAAVVVILTTVLQYGFYNGKYWYSGPAASGLVAPPNSYLTIYFDGSDWVAGHTIGFATPPIDPSNITSLSSNPSVGLNAPEDGWICCIAAPFGGATLFLEDESIFYDCPICFYIYDEGAGSGVGFSVQLPRLGNTSPQNGKPSYDIIEPNASVYIGNISWNGSQWVFDNPNIGSPQFLNSNSYYPIGSYSEWGSTGLTGSIHSSFDGVCPATPA